MATENSNRPEAGNDWADYLLEARLQLDCASAVAPSWAELEALEQLINTLDRLLLVSCVEEHGL